MEAAVTPPRCVWVSGMKLRLGRTRAGSKITADQSVDSLLELFLWSARAWASTICCSGRTWVVFEDFTGCRARWAGAGGEWMGDIAAREVGSLKIDAARRTSQACARIRYGAVAVVVREGGVRRSCKGCLRIAWSGARVMAYGSMEG